MFARLAIKYVVSRFFAKSFYWQFEYGSPTHESYQINIVVTFHSIFEDIVGNELELHAIKAHKLLRQLTLAYCFFVASCIMMVENNLISLRITILKQIFLFTTSKKTIAWLIGFEVDINSMLARILYKNPRMMLYNWLHISSNRLSNKDKIIHWNKQIKPKLLNWIINPYITFLQISDTM